MSAEVASRPTEASRDHMIPQTFTAFLSPRKKAEFNADWNLQPMHKACNERRRGQCAGNWPLFTCRCHYLQIADDHIYVHDRLQENDRQHLLFENAVSSECGVQAPVVLRMWGGGKLARLGQRMYAAIAARYRTSKELLCRMTTPTARWLRFGNDSLTPGTYEAAAH